MTGALREGVPASAGVALPSLPPYDLIEHEGEEKDSDREEPDSGDDEDELYDRARAQRPAFSAPSAMAGISVSVYSAGSLPEVMIT